ncbi:hypothetical protein DY000_02027357 [Brassica cretica]|uniref:Uncharacterized protein n=1 Tax=Brassica cretica TaxID=69181 RepID=A0ABQ7E3E6_BRACR|nr:hypothetical protein DY000_02027357 [Brassica cretica]
MVITAKLTVVCLEISPCSVPHGNSQDENTEQQGEGDDSRSEWSELGRVLIRIQIRFKFSAQRIQ